VKDGGGGVNGRREKGKGEGGFLRGWERGEGEKKGEEPRR